MENNKPLVSVIVNCYNGEQFLKEAIDSIYAQTYNNWEIIFWDNASSDDSANIARSFDKKLKYYRAKKQTKLYNARNLALEKCLGSFVAFLDCDDVWIDQKLEMQIELALRGGGNDFVYGGYQNINSNGELELRVSEKYFSQNYVDILIAIFRQYSTEQKRK